YRGHMEELKGNDLDGAETDAATGTVKKGGKTIGILADGKPRAGFKTPSKRLEIYSQTMVDWGWPEYSLPAAPQSHTHGKRFDPAKGEHALVPPFRLPTLIHTRSGNSKWLYELSNTNPVWIHPEDAARIGVQTTDLVRVTTRTGYYVNRVWVTE